VRLARGEPSFSVDRMLRIILYWISISKISIENQYG
jgi:hypothetical protein